MTDAPQGLTRKETRSFFTTEEGFLRSSGDLLMFPARVIVRVVKYSWHTALGVVDCYVSSYPLLCLWCWESLTSALAVF